MTMLSQGHASASAPAAAWTAMRDVAASVLPSAPVPAKRRQDLKDTDYSQPHD